MYKDNIEFNNHTKNQLCNTNGSMKSRDQETHIKIVINARIKVLIGCVQSVLCKVVVNLFL